RRRGDRSLARAREERRHLRRHLERRHVRRGAQGRARSGPGLRDPRDAAGHRRALPLHTAVRGHLGRWRSRAVVSGSPRETFDREFRAVAPGLADVSIGPATKFARLPEPFHFWRGGSLSDGRVAYETWGTLNPARDNAVLLFTGLSPSAHAASSPADP